MKATGIVRRIDDLGRVVIPKEIRKTLRIKEGTPLEIFTDREGEIILKKYSPIGELNVFAKEYAVVNVSDLSKFVDGTVVDTEMLKASGLVKKVNDGVKVLGNGELTSKITVKAAKFSKSAIEKIEKAGGKAEVI